ncbi:hypothetical protein AKJ36_02085 [candidate division MSBL1 archaeon SCGC-AAA259I07]|uniref:Uncharacterized protein n=1 Tax=candidate division MSBL1 archaeon SCGC-AAA259I07 TaxID=1698266 RepID=A0A133UL03_9EURY|nr:hypothetical protein AKJ36_02085 [candidate division MSBL1 archaeon SCGC-AAA259I07]
MTEVKVTIPAYLPDPSDEEIEEIENLLAKFGNVRRRAYSMKNKKGMSKSEISPILQEETGLNRRYCDDAYNSIKDLPSIVGDLPRGKLKMSGHEDVPVPFCNYRPDSDEVEIETDKYVRLTL